MRRSNKVGLLLLFVIFCFATCGRLESNSTRAELIPGPPGYQCFVIYNNASEAIGGNCVSK